MATTIILLIIGLIVLIVGGDFLVKGSSSIALRFHISPLVVGLTIVSLGTSAPELLVSVQSALKGSPDLAMGNVVGSNICNLALVLGLTAVFNPVKVHPSSIKVDWPMTMGASLLLYFMVRSSKLDWHEGVLFVAILVAYIFFIVRHSIKTNKLELENLQVDEDIPDIPRNQVWRDLFSIAIGGIALFFGSEWFVNSSRDLALSLGVEERVVGLTVVALGTSLPEMVTSVIASMKGESDLALGNLMGSNIFNILCILGITSTIRPITVNEAILNTDMVWMLLITLMILPLMIMRKLISRIDGAILLFIYLVYFYTVIQ